MIAFASSQIARPAWPGRTRSVWPVTRSPPISFACSILLCASLSSPSSSASSGRFVGTLTSERTWIPRARRAASRAAVATVSGENGSSSNATSTLWYSTSSTPSGVSDSTFTVLVSGSCWWRR